MKDYTTMPKEGQFIAVWEYDGNFWSGNYKWVDGELCHLGNDTDIWEKAKGFPYEGQENVRYLRSN